MEVNMLWLIPKSKLAVCAFSFVVGALTIVVGLAFMAATVYTGARMGVHKESYAMEFLAKIGAFLVFMVSANSSYTVFVYSKHKLAVLFSWLAGFFVAILCFLIWIDSVTLH